MEAAADQPAIANENEDSGISVSGSEKPPPTPPPQTTTTTTTTTSGQSSEAIRTKMKTEEIPIPTVTTKIKVDTSKMKEVCNHLEGRLMQMVDDTREDDLFLTRIQEEFISADEKWETKVTTIARDFFEEKKQMVDEAKKREILGLEEEFAGLQQRLTDSEKEREELNLKLRTKRVKAGMLEEEMAKLKEGMKEEQVWKDKVEKQLKNIQTWKEDSKKERLDAINKISNQIIRFRNKRVPDVGELKDLHELIDRIHHSMGYLMVLGQQPPITNDRVLDAKET